MISRRTNYGTKGRPKSRPTKATKVDQKREVPPPVITVERVDTRRTLSRFLEQACAVLAYEKSSHVSSLIFLQEALSERLPFDVVFQLHGLEERRMKDQVTLYAVVRLSLNKGGNRHLIEEMTRVAPWWKHELCLPTTN